MSLFNTFIAQHVSSGATQIVGKISGISVHCHNMCHYVFPILQYKIINGDFQVLVAVVMKCLLFKAVILCSLVHSTWLIFYPER
jgi:hypothetical protein